MGKVAVCKPLVDFKGRDPKEFNHCLHFVAEFEDYAKTISAFDLERLLPALIADEAVRVQASIAAIDAIHDHIMTRL